MNIKKIATAAVALSSLTSTVCVASIVGTTGSIINNGQLTSGTDLGLNQTQSSTEIRAYTESQETLAIALAVDEVGSAFTSAGTIATGTQVQSYLLHLDPAGSTQVTLSGTITFSTQILGIIIDTSTLDNSDSVLGVSGVTYYTGTERGLEAGQDTYTISGNTLTFGADFTASSPMDEVRIVTAAAAPVPEPTTVLAGALLLVPFGASCIRGLRNRKQAA